MTLAKLDSCLATGISHQHFSLIELHVLGHIFTIKVGIISAIFSMALSRFVVLPLHEACDSSSWSSLDPNLHSIH